ncbi:hypothetical protein HS125_18525 [bacterium]|nr:hypothetical protein [bacterium]
MQRIILITILGLPMLALGFAGWAADRNVPSPHATIVDALNAAQPGDRIVISGTHTESVQIPIGLDNLTITSGAIRADIREARFFVTSSNVTFRDVDINGKSVSGVRNPNNRDLIILTETSGNVTFEGCRIVNPASGAATAHDTASNNFDAQTSPGSCIEIRSSGPVTVRNCNFVNDDDYAASGINAEVCIHFSEASGGSLAGPYLIENSVFRFHSKGVSITHGYDNITIRGNHMDLSNDNPDDGSSSSIYMHTDFTDSTGVVANLLIEGNTFDGAPDADNDGAGGRCIFLATGKIDNAVIRNNTFRSTIANNAIRSYARGTGLVIDNNSIDVRSGQGVGGAVHFAARTSYNSATALPPMHPELEIRNLVFTGNLVTGNTALAMLFDENCVGPNTVADNVFLDIAGTGIEVDETPNSTLFRNNRLERCGGNAALDITGRGSSLLGNFILDCPVGIRIDTAGSNYGSTLSPHLDRRPQNILISRNVVLRMTGSGIIDQTVDSGTDGQGNWIGRSVGIRYVNNTIANSGGANLTVRGDAISVYNNLFMGGPGGSLNDAGATVFSARGFNLYYNTTAGNVPMTSTDINSLLPPVVGGALPGSLAAVQLRPDSLAIDAGSTNGIDPDYTTDIGAFELGAVADTGVPAGGWELYR